VSHSEEGGFHRGTIGMTLRDWFAGQALVSIADACYIQDEISAPSDVAAAAFALADAMLAERAKKDL
jgi:hypothetical protein